MTRRRRDRVRRARNLLRRVDRPRDPKTLDVLDRAFVLSAAASVRREIARRA